MRCRTLTLPGVGLADDELELVKGSLLNLSDTLTSHVEHDSDLLERSSPPIHSSKPEENNLSLSGHEAGKRPLNLVRRKLGIRSRQQVLR